MVKVAGALEPPPPPPVHGVTQPGCGGDGGLKTVTLAVKFVEPAFTRRSGVTVAISWLEVDVERTVNCLCVPAMLHFTWDPPEGSVVGRKAEPLSDKVKGAVHAEAVHASALVGLMLVRTGDGLAGGLT